MIRRADASDLDVVRALRLEALKDAPDAFGSTFEREVGFSDGVWIDRLRSARSATFVGFDGDEAAGLAVGAVEKPGDAASLYSMWVRSNARGTGIGDRLVEAVLAWAGEVGRTTVRLHVTEGNERAARLYDRHGFRPTGESITRDRDGRVEIEFEAVVDVEQG